MKARIYTKTGDQGETSLVGGSRVSKSHLRLEAYGTLDELNASLGVVCAHLRQLQVHGEFVRHLEARLQMVQNALFNIGSHLACEDSQLTPKLPGLNPSATAALEQDMDSWESELPVLRNFILPGGSPLASFAHVARTVCRRGEREMVRLSENGVPVDTAQIVFLNRLSDWLFLLARKLNSLVGASDAEWSKT